MKFKKGDKVIVTRKRQPCDVDDVTWSRLLKLDRRGTIADVNTCQESHPYLVAERTSGRELTWFCAQELKKES